MVRQAADAALNWTRAVARLPADTFAAGLSIAGLGPPDLDLARRQHAQYCAALESLGVSVTLLPPDANFPDSTFVEDAAVVIPQGAMITRPGAPSRAGEVAAIRAALAGLCATVAEIAAPGTLDGGDVCQVGQHFFIGISRRSNEEGARQLTDWLRHAGFTAETVDLRARSELLHLKSGLAWLGGRTVVVADSLAGHPALRGCRRIVASPAESYAANCLRIYDQVLMPAGYPALARRVAALGLAVRTLEVSEFAKMDGGLSCLSLRLH